MQKSNSEAQSRPSKDDCYFHLHSFIFCSIALFWDLPALPCEYVECINWGEYTSLLYHARHQHTMEHASATTDIALI